MGVEDEEKKGTLQIRAYSRNMDQAVLKPSLGSTARTSRLVSSRLGSPQEMGI